MLDGSVRRVAKFELRREPFESENITGVLQIPKDILHILAHEMRQQETIMNLRAPPHQGFSIRLFPELGGQGPKQEMLRETHPGMRGHLEGSHFKQSEPARRRFGSVQLVDAKLGAVCIAGRINQ